MDGCTVERVLRIERGTVDDYRHLEGFHYRGARPRAVTRVLAARVDRNAGSGRGDDGGFVAGVVVETYPVLNCALRGVALPGRYCGPGFVGDRRAGALRLNAEMRTIARVIVHPTFRGMGLGVRLVRRMLATAETRYVETLAAMGRYSPLFEKAGMTRFDRAPPPDNVRLLASLATAGLRPVDLVDLRGRAVGPKLRAELRRFARHKSAGVEGWIAEARARLLSRPVYYLWSRDAVPHEDMFEPHINNNEHAW